MRWPPVTFTVGMSNLLGHVGDGAQLPWIGQPAPHARHDRIGAVLLDVGVDTLVDEARAAIVHVFLRPIAEKVVVQGRPALGAAARRSSIQLLHDRRNRLELLPPGSDGAHRHGRDRCSRTSARSPTCANLSPSVSVITCSTRPVQVPQEAEAFVCARTSVERAQALVGDSLDDLTLADAVAAADFRIIRQGCNGRRRVQGGPPA